MRNQDIFYVLVPFYLNRQMLKCRGKCVYSVIDFVRIQGKFMKFKAVIECLLLTFSTYVVEYNCLISNKS